MAGIEFELAHGLLGTWGENRGPLLTDSRDKVEGLEPGGGCHDVLRHVVVGSGTEARR